jgi:hypothetical protein
MQLIVDDRNGVYIWVAIGGNESIPVSPHFDYEEDAILWYKNYILEMRKLRKSSTETTN